jgi:hypothetical protein
MMSSASSFVLSAMVLALAACTEQPSSNDAPDDPSARTTTMEGGGVYPSPSPSLAVEPMAKDPAAAATQNEQRNLAPPVK